MLNAPSLNICMRLFLFRPVIVSLSTTSNEIETIMLSIQSYKHIRSERTAIIRLKTILFHLFENEMRSVRA